MDNLISVLRFLDNLEELHLDVMDITSGDFNSLSLQLSDCKKIKFLGLGYNKLDNGCLTTLSVLLDSLLLHGRVSPRCYPDIIQISHEVVRFYHITENLTNNDHLPQTSTKKLYGKIAIFCFNKRFVAKNFPDLLNVNFLQLLLVIKIYYCQL